jgi:hypothetical protein
MLAGVADPIACLKLPIDEWELFVLAIDEALKLKDERETTIVKTLIRGIGGEVASEVSKMVASMFR